MIADRERAREVFNIVSHVIESGAGIRTHLGKLKGWSRSFSSRPPGFDDFGDDFWKGDADSENRGLKILGTPIGHEDFVNRMAEERLESENFLSICPN